MDPDCSMQFCFDVVLCLLQVIVDDLDNAITYKFPCGRWLATDEDDGQICRDLLVGKGAVDVNTGSLSIFPDF